MPTFAPAAPYRPLLAVSAMRAPRPGTWAVKGDDGVVLDTVPLLEGEWLVREGNTVSTEIDDAAFQRSYDAIPGRARRHTRKAPAETLQAPLGGTEAAAFAASHLRCSGDGATLYCSVDLPLGEQARLLLAHPDDPYARHHLAVLRTLRDDIASRPVYDPAVQADLHLFDILTAMGDAAPEADDATARADAERAAWEDERSDDEASPANIPGLVARAMAAEGLSPTPWISLARTDIAEVRQLRALGERIFGALTDTPIGAIRLTLHPHTEDSNPVTDLAAWLRRTAEAKPLERKPDLSNVARDYHFEAERYVRDGVEFLIVEDLMAAYVYAWPATAPTPTPKPR